MRGLLIVLGLLLSGAAQAQIVPSIIFRHSGNTLPGATVDLNFATQQFLPSAALSQITETRNSIATQDGLDGTWYQFSPRQFRLTSKGHLHEESRTNLIPNASATGASIGVLPTGWQVSAGNGITCSVVGVGSESGMPYIQEQCTGTTSAAMFIAVTYVPNNTTIAASQNQVLSNSGFYKLVSGNFAGATTNPSLVINEYSNVGGFLAQGFSPTFVPTGAAIGTQRQQFSYLVSNASTAFVSPLWQVNYPISTSVNFTVEIGWPQIELNPNATTVAQGFATSPIPTSSGAVTRLADSATMPLPAGACNAAGCSLWATENFEAPVGYPNRQYPAAISDGTTNNAVALLRGQNTSNGAGTSTVAAFTVNNSLATVINQTTPAKLADYVTASLLTVVLNNGAPQAVASNGVPPVTTLSVGSFVFSGSARPCDCYIARIAVAPTSLLGS